MEFDETGAAMTPEEQMSTYGYLLDAPDLPSPVTPPREHLDYRTVTPEQILTCTPQEKHWLDQQAAADLAPFMERSRKADPKKYRSKRRASRQTDLKYAVKLRVDDPDLARWLALRDGVPFIEYLFDLLKTSGKVDLIDGVNPQKEFSIRLPVEDVRFLKTELGGPTNFVRILKEIGTYGRYEVTGKEREVKR